MQFHNFNERYGRIFNRNAQSLLSRKGLDYITVCDVIIRGFRRISFY